jgi:hypothetical protein
MESRFVVQSRLADPEHRVKSIMRSLQTPTLDGIPISIVADRLTRWKHQHTRVRGDILYLQVEQESVGQEVWILLARTVTVPPIVGYCGPGVKMVQLL